jgi:hypothetical protein
LSLVDQGVLINSETAQIGLCKAWSYYMKDLYRNGFLTSQLSTSVAGADSSDACDGTSSNPCGYVCNNSRRDEMATFLSTLVNSRFTPSSMGSEDWMSYVDFICTGDAKYMFIGTHMESSSAADPSFWPAHPTQERLLHAKMMSNLITSWEWPTSATEGQFTLDLQSWDLLCIFYVPQHGRLLLPFISNCYEIISNYLC